jgi:Cft2 family RNA processing exonuclease
MKITDLNRHGEIGANALFIELGSFKLLIDCGLHPKKLGHDATPDFGPIEGVDLDLIILTHCHLDHLGALPLAAARNPETPVITAPPNLILAPRMLRNSINVMKRQREEHGIAEYPLFLHRDVAYLNHQLTAQRFERGELYEKNGEQIEVILHPAGHVAGAAAVELIHEERRIVVSGDVLFDAQRTLPGAHLPEGTVDTLIMETTRGAKARAPERTRSSEIDRLITQIAQILERGGSCLIPVFALGRMQEMFKILYEARNFGRLPKCPIHAAGLGMAICDLFDSIRKRTRLIDFDREILETMRVRPVDDNMRPGRDLPRKGIYLVSSGMMVEHTPSYKIAASLLPHPKNGLCFVGYCDPDTPGGRLLEQRDAERFFFEALDYSAPRRASIDQFDLSGHAERQELLDYAMATQARSIVLTHGDTEARQWFARELTQQMPRASVLDPSPLVRYEV